MVTRLTYQSNWSDCEAVHIPTSSSIGSSDGFFRNTTKESPNIYVREKRRRKPKYDPSEWEMGSTVSLRRPRRISNTTAVSHASLVQSKTETVEEREMYSSSFAKEKLVDFHTHTKISSCTSDSVSREMIPVECPNPAARPKRKHTQRSWSGSRKQSKRTSEATSVLPKRLTNLEFDHCFQNMWSGSPEERRKMVTYLTCYYFYMYSVEHSRERVLSWIKRLNIFSKEYVFVPILLWSHWSLLVFCHLGESLDSRTRTPCMLLLDSLLEYGSPSKLEPLIRRLVLEIFETEGRPESKDMIEKIPLMVPKVPQQINGMDCGIFVLYYINLFLEGAPENFSISDGYPYFMTEKWFTNRELKVFYEKLEALGLQPDEEEDSLDSGDSEADFERVYM